MYLLREDSTTAATKYFNMRTAIFFQKVFHVLEKLYVTTLIGGNGNTLGVFFDSAFHYFSNTAVVTEMDDLRALALKNATHDIDSSIMTVEEGCCSNDTDLVDGLITHIDRK